VTRPRRTFLQHLCHFLAPTLVYSRSQFAFLAIVFATSLYELNIIINSKGHTCTESKLALARVLVTIFLRTGLTARKASSALSAKVAPKGFCSIWAAFKRLQAWQCLRLPGSSLRAAPVIRQPCLAIGKDWLQPSARLGGTLGNCEQSRELLAWNEQ
jgi:hypothetical protein